MSGQKKKKKKLCLKSLFFLSVLHQFSQCGGQLETMLRSLPCEMSPWRLSMLSKLGFTLLTDEESNLSAKTRKDDWQFLTATFLDYI